MQARRYFSGPAAVIGWGVVAIVLELVLLALWFGARDAYVGLGVEDAVGENLTALFYAVAGVLIWLNSVRLVRSGKSSWLGQTWPFLLGALFVVIAGEEISWGQRFLGFSTPESMKAENLQSEFNFHNLQAFDKGSAVLNQHTVLNVFALLYGVLIPWAYNFSTKARGLLDRFNFPVVPLSLTIFFVVGLVHGQTVAKWDPHWAHTEVKELIFAIGFLIFAASLPERERPPAAGD